MEERVTKKHRCRNRSDRPNRARVLSGASELAAYPRPFVTGLLPIQKLASKTGGLLAHVAKYLDTQNIQREAEIKLAPKKPVGVRVAPASAAILGVWIHWDPPRLAVKGLRALHGGVRGIRMAVDIYDTRITSKGRAWRQEDFLLLACERTQKEQVQKVLPNRYSKIEPSVSESYRRYTSFAHPISYQKAPEQAKSTNSRKFKTKK